MSRQPRTNFDRLSGRARRVTRADSYVSNRKDGTLLAQHRRSVRLASVRLNGSVLGCELRLEYVLVDAFSNQRTTYKDK